MQLVVKGKGFEVNDAVRSYAQDKISKLDRYLDQFAETSVELAAEKTKNAGDRFVAQVTISTNGTLLRGEEKGSDPYTALDSVLDVMQRQMQRYKERGTRKGRASAAKVVGAQVASDIEGISASEEPSIVRTKSFPLKPMEPEEAVEQMELLGHDFFVFYNAGSEGINVLYRRRDGNYGLLVPELT